MRPWLKQLTIFTISVPLTVYGSIAFFGWIVPKEGELFKRFNPELQARNLALREERLKNYQEFLDQLKEYSRDGRPIWVVAKEAQEKEERERRERRGKGGEGGKGWREYKEEKMRREREEEEGRMGKEVRGEMGVVDVMGKDGLCSGRGQVENRTDGAVAVGGVEIGNGEEMNAVPGKGRSWWGLWSKSTED